MFEAPKNIFRTCQSCEAVNNSSLRPEEVELILRPFSPFNILCRQVIECELLFAKHLGDLSNGHHLFQQKQHS